MLALILLAALAASTAGSPSAVLELGDKAALQRIQDVPYTVALLKSLKHLGPAALISPNYVLAAAHIVGDSTAASLKVRAGTAYSFWLNPLGVTVEVSQVQLHPDWQAGQDAADVAVLTLAKSLASSSTAIAAISVLGVSAPPPGSRAVVSGWGWSPSLKSEKVWLVLPKYCEAQEGLCVTAAVESGAPLAVDGQLVGFASKQSVNKNNNVQPVGFGSLAEPAVQKFIAAATTPVPPTPETTAAPEPTTETTPSEASTKSPPRPSSNSGVASDGAAHAPRVTECAIHVNGGLPSNNQPILVRPDLGPDGLPAFREPDNGDAVLLAAGERVRLVCSGKGNYFKFNKAFNDVLAECVSDTAFLINGKQVEVHQLACKTTAVNDAVRAGRCLDGKYTSINIGFKVGEGFVTQIENCFNDKTLDAVYSRMVMSPAIAGHESGVKRPSFSPGAFYEGVDVNKLYKAQTQRATVGKLLGDPALGDKYIQDSQHGDRFLARGHLAAKADFIQGAQQRATFYYVNAAPQWQTFNGGNWAKLEDSVRDYVMQGNKTVQVVTGTWGTASLPNKDGVDTPLYLQGDRKLVRVPKYYWKVVYHPETKSGVAFVGLNNPYHDLTAEDVFCEDVCGQYSWATWKPQDQSHGYGFCCDVNELKKVVDTLPADIVVNGLL